MKDWEKNRAADFVNRFVNATDQHVFLTGKAGTGKTTLLKQIVETTHKKTMIAAPTGIAAINAGGITLHSLFHLPFGTFIPEDRFDTNMEISFQVTTPNGLIKNLHMHGTKRALIQEMELLIIDEVSMLRADLLDAIDTVLRFVRRTKSQPFGGIQILFIGDLWQLPPVVKDEERPLMNRYYPNAYFFNAHALRGCQPVYIELEHIYRQSDPQFIQLLNHFRVNEVTPHDIEVLNQKYVPGFNPVENRGYIYLTTHNYKADNINHRALQQLKSPTFHFDAQLEGDFPEYLYPVDFTLELKEGAQVMFIKNDYSGENAYFNGKIGKVDSISGEHIEVAFDDGSPSAIVERYTWENKKFSLNKETREIEETVAGKFSHYPIKLAWAITVHKSQGLTFDKAMIDVSQAFAPGQIYVALSRLTSLKGLVLASLIRTEAPDIDPALLNYSQSQQDQKHMEATFYQSSQEFLKKQVLQAFQFQWMIDEMKMHLESYDKDERKSTKQKYLGWALALQKEIIPLVEIADKFQGQIRQLSQNQQPESVHLLLQRVGAARQYFQPLFNQLQAKVAEHKTVVKREKGIKKYLTELLWVEGIFFRQLLNICKAEAMCQSVVNHTGFNKDTVRELSETIRPKTAINEPEAKKRKSKNAAGHEEGVGSKSGTKANEISDTRRASLEIFMQNRSVEETAKERGMAVSTIEGHLAGCIELGLLDVSELVPTKKLNNIVKVAQELETQHLSPIKELLGDDYSYSEIKFVIAYLRFELANEL